MGTHAVEDYLKAIYELQEEEGRAKTSRLAEKLGVTPGSVTDMLKRLSQSPPGLLTYRHHYGVQLTSKGRAEALDVIRRHRLLETFLHQILGLNWDEVHQEAEVLEHHISTRVADAIDRLLEHPEFDPHGEPIPRQSGALPTVSEKRLSDVDIGSAFRIVRVLPTESALLQHLDAIGIGIDSTGVMVEKAPFDGPLTFRPGRRGDQPPRTIGRNVADQLFVDILPSS